MFKFLRKSVLVAAVLLAVFTVIYYIIKPLGVKLEIGAAQYRVELAITQAEKSKGLSGRPDLDDGHGLLFVYDHKEQYRFWMKGMKFPLDFVWIADGKVVDLTENVPPPVSEENPAILSPKTPVNQILELPGGSISRSGLKIGDGVKVKF